MEIWDGYKADRTKAGVDIVRDGEFPAGLYHIVGETIVRHADGTFLVMRRDLNKVGWPGAWEIGAGGSVLKGETAYEGALRELYEETGVKAETLKLLEIASEVHENGVGVHYYIYLCDTDMDKSAVRLQAGETIDYRWIPRDELLTGDYIVERVRDIVRRYL